jgi:hypothetical protein
VPAFQTGVALVLGFHALGLGPALLLRRSTDLPWRYVYLLTLLATCLLSYAIFWISFFLPSARLPVVAVALGISGLLTITAVPPRLMLATMRRRPLWALPLATALFATACLWPLLRTGPGVNDRFAWKLPSDNILPGLLANRVVLRASTVRPVPPLWPNGDRASERPPLQAAVVVAVGSLLPGVTDEEHLLLATLCQAQWLPALVLVAMACGVRRRALVIVTGACIFSGFFFVNTIYTWPKLFAAALMLGALAIAIEPPAERPSARRARTIAAATLTALSLLAHPGTVFSLIAVPVCWPWLRPLVHLSASRSAIAWSLLSITLLNAPWIAYQALIDPPAGRLLREHLGDGRPQGSVFRAIVSANLERPLGEHLQVRFGNLAAQLGNPVAAVWPDSIADGQSQQFFRHGASLGVLLIGLLLLVRPAREDVALHAVRRLAAWAVIALAIWSLLIYGPGQALIHHGSPVTTALLFLVGAYGLTRLPGIAMGILLAVHAGTFLMVWVAPMGWGPWHPDGSGLWPIVGFVLLAAGAMGMVALAAPAAE